MIFRSLEDSEDFYKSLNWIEIHEDYHWYYEICRNLNRKMGIVDT